MTIRFEFEATISDKGEPVPTGIRAPGIAARLQTMRGRSALVTVEVERKARSARQNRRYWGCIVPFARELLSVSRDLPLSLDQTHYALKAAFLGITNTTLGPVPKSTRNLSVPEFENYCLSIVSHFNALGHFLPDHPLES
jgi:hypothetical protein